MSIGRNRHSGEGRNLDDTSEAGTNVMTDVETFRAPWPRVLVEMKDFVDLWFLAMGKKRQAGMVRIFISKALVSQAQLQPHVREFRASLSRIPNYPIELKGTDQAAHRIEIEYRR